MPADPIRQQSLPRQVKPKTIREMNRDAILGIVRHVLTTAGGVLVTNGTLSNEQLQTGGGAIVVLIGLIWSVLSKREKA